MVFNDYCIYNYHYNSDLFLWFPQKYHLGGQYRVVCRQSESFVGFSQDPHILNCRLYLPSLPLYLNIFFACLPDICSWLSLAVLLIATCLFARLSFRNLSMSSSQHSQESSRIPVACHMRLCVFGGALSRTIQLKSRYGGFLI